MSPPVKKKVGRPSKYTPELLSDICARLSQGEPLAQICRTPGYPNRSTVGDWADADPDVSRLIARAREEGEEVLAAQCLQIADTPMEGEEQEVDGGGNVTRIKRGDMLGHRKLQIETRLKLLAKWNPKKWGDRQSLEHSGANGAPLFHTGPIIIGGEPDVPPDPN